MIERIRYTDTCSVTPDLINIPMWGYLLYYTQDDAVSISYDGISVSIVGHGAAHPLARRLFKHFNKTFDIRLWKDSKVVSIWTTPEYEMFKSLIDIEKAISSNSYKHLYGEIIHIGNLNEYKFLFCEQKLLDVYVVRCNLLDLKDLNEKSIVSNELERKWHIWTPEEKIQRLNENRILRLERYSHYRTMCSKWEHKIGNMDVVEWHLLIYED